ncbi:hypothetical protein [Labrenzia sp. VG12]|uniref:hypothetical protein n=1 Tax=Labrenzia sp. VG12 TaxID=2021862 RepID=UPI000B8BD977|nr:hypothetical protein [Labrenzia sp. VG12]ASP35638.1 hypothetical protein CHH27_22335 [Labrenzia sp. VG12]
MPAADDLRNEINHLKKDADASKTRSRKRRPKKATPEEDAPTEPQLDASGMDLDELSQRLSELVNDAEDDIRRNPLIAVAGAFALGLVVGSILRR